MIIKCIQYRYGSQISFVCIVFCSLFKTNFLWKGSGLMAFRGNQKLTEPAKGKKKKYTNKQTMCFLFEPLEIPSANLSCPHSCKVTWQEAKNYSSLLAFSMTWTFTDLEPSVWLTYQEDRKHGYCWCIWFSYHPMLWDVPRRERESKFIVYYHSLESTIYQKIPSWRLPALLKFISSLKP